MKPLSPSESLSMQATLDGVMAHATRLAEAGWTGERIMRALIDGGARAEFRKDDGSTSLGFDIDKAVTVLARIGKDGAS